MNDVIPKPIGHGRDRQRAGGMSLLELVLALAVMSIVIVGIGSAILLASRALPQADSPTAAVNKAAATLDQLTSELAVAMHMTERTATAVTFTVADRNGDAIPERIRYAWSGTPGDPLTRQYNAGTAATVIDDVHAFALSYDTRSATEQYPGLPAESAEAELISYDSASSLGDQHVHDNLWWAQYFKPTLPADAVQWKVNRIKFNARRDDNSSAITTIRLELPNVSNWPSGTVVDTATMQQLDLTSSYQWIEKTFTNATNLDPDNGLCITFTTADSKSCQLRYQNGNVTAPNLGLIEGDPLWKSLVTDESLLFYVYGTYLIPNPPVTVTRQYVTAVRVALQVGDNTATLTETSVQTLNAPEVLSAVWETDFEADPTSVDLNGDGVADWHATDASAFDAGQLNNGLWRVRGDLWTNPGYGFNDLTTVDARLRDVNDEGAWGGIILRVDRTGNTYAFIRADIVKIGSTQTLSVWSYDSGGALVPMLIEPDLPDQFIDLRLLVDPVRDSFNVQVDGRDLGTFAYNRITVVTPHVCRLYETATISGTQFDHVRIRVGGSSP